MMKKIYKYTLEVLDGQRLDIPTGSKLLSVAEQYEKIVLYALVDDARGGLDSFEIFIKGTGHPADDISDCEFLGTVKLARGKLMFHVFYKQVKK